MHEKIQRLKNYTWLSENGLRMDHIRKGRSTIQERLATVLSLHVPGSFRMDKWWLRMPMAREACMRWKVTASKMFFPIERKKQQVHNFC